MSMDTPPLRGLDGYDAPIVVLLKTVLSRPRTSWLIPMSSPIRRYENLKIHYYAYMDTGA